MAYRERICSIQDLPSNVAAELRRVMPSDESILGCFEKDEEEIEGLFTSHIDRKDYYAYVITQNQIIRYSQTIRHDIRQDTETIESTRVVDMANIAETRGKTGFSVLVYDNMNNDIQYSFVSHELGRKFSDILRQAIAESKAKFSKIPPRPTRTLHERLQVLTEMHNDALITDAEFEQKRKEILNEI